MPGAPEQSTCPMNLFSNLAPAAMHDTIALLYKYFSHTPTREQKTLIPKLAAFLEDREQSRPVFLLTGYAGTGKTSCLQMLAKTARKLRYRIKLLAPTGRAAKIISNYSRQQAGTLHRQIYQQVQHPYSGQIEFRRRHNKTANCLYIVDEASMIGQAENEQQADLLTDLLQYVFEQAGNKLVLVGDTAQLPPVGQLISPALHPEILQYAYRLQVRHHQLQSVTRQQQDSGILQAAGKLRRQLTDGAPEPVELQSRGFHDLFRIREEQLLPGLQYAYKQFGLANSLLICASNQDAASYNRLIRERILGRKAVIEEKDLLMIARNNYQAFPGRRKGSFLANGEFVEVLEVLGEETVESFRFLRLRLCLPDYKKEPPFESLVMLENLESQDPSLRPARMRELYELVAGQYTQLGSRARQLKAIRKDPYLNALQVKFAYALTCHKAQGGQWPVVFVHPGFWQQPGGSPDNVRWFYTAFTRAARELYLIDTKSFTPHSF